MALTKEVSTRGEFLEDGQVQVCTVTQVFEDDIMIAQNLHRHVVAPGDDYSGEADNVKAICSAIQTSDVVTKYITKIAALTPMVIAPKDTPPEVPGSEVTP